MNAGLVPDAVVRVRLYDTREGGRQSAIPPIQYRCPVYIGEQREQANDCAFLLDRVARALEPGGASQVVPIKFLVPELVADKLRPGTRLVLWEGREIGEAEVIEVSISEAGD